MEDLAKQTMAEFKLEYQQTPESGPREQQSPGQYGGRLDVIEAATVAYIAARLSTNRASRLIAARYNQRHGTEGGLRIESISIEGYQMESVDSERRLPEDMPLFHATYAALNAAATMKAKAIDSIEPTYLARWRHVRTLRFD